MEFDKAGYLWMSTEGGIVRFDGSAMKVMDVLSNPELSMDRGNRILKTLDEDVFVQSSVAGLFTYEGGKLRELENDNGESRPSTWIKGAIPDSKVFNHVVNERVVQQYINNPERQFVTMFPLGDSSFILIGWKEPMLFHNTTFVKSFANDSYKPVGYLMVNGQFLFVDHQHRLFKIDVNNGSISSCHVNGSDWDHLSVNPYFEYTFFCSSPFRESYIISGSSLYRLSASDEAGQFNYELITDGLPSGCVINAVAVDATGSNIAIGTDSKGLFLFHKNLLKTVQVNSGSAPASMGNVYYVQFPLDSYRVLTTNNRIFDARTGQIGHSVIGPYESFAMMRDSKGYIWYAYQDSIFRYDEMSQVRKAIAKKVKTEINVFYEDSDKIWVGSQSGLGYIKDDSVTMLHPDAGDPTYSLHRVSGRLMVGSGHGVYFLNPVTFERDALHTLDGVCVRTLEMISDIVFIGTYDGGFYLWKDNKLIKAPLDRYGGLKDVHAFFDDSLGYVWMTSNRGLYKTKLSSFQQFLADSTFPVYYYRYSVKDGITLDEFNGGCSPSYAKLANGTVTLPTMEGLVYFKPENTPAMLSTASIFIDAILVNGTRIPATSVLELDCYYRQVEIFFSTPYWGAEENIWLDYRIDGNPEQWMPLHKNQRSLVVLKLPFGSHKISFRKRSGFDAGDWVYLDLSIYVAPYYYQTWWFIVLIILLLVGLFWLATHIYARNIISRNNRLESIIKQRTGELMHANENLAVSQKSLQQSITVKNKLISILSHDIITPLRFIGLSAKMAVQRKNDDGQLLTQTLGDIQNATFKLHDNASNILEWINLQNQRISVQISHVPLFSLVDELFERLKELSRVRQNQMTNAVSEDLIFRTDAQLLNIILYNILSNAIKHTRNGIIKVTATDETTHFLIEITDNGNGIPQQILERINEPTAEQLLRSGYTENDFGGSGLGYLLIKDLLPLINGNFTVQSEEGKGTRVQLRFESSPATVSFSE